jgi:hypothetical protein
LAGNLVKPLLSLYGTEWRERGYGLRFSLLGKSGPWWGKMIHEKSLLQKISRHCPYLNCTLGCDVMLCMAGGLGGSFYSYQDKESLTVFNTFIPTQVSEVM